MKLRSPNSVPRIDAAGEYKTYVPHTPGIRHLKRPNHPHLWMGKPLHDLTVHKRSTGGRNNAGRLTVAGRGGGHRRRIRLVDTRRPHPGEYDVVRIERDPGRSGHLALVRHRTSGALSYILAASGVRAGDTVQTWRSAESKTHTQTDDVKANVSMGDMPEYLKIDLMRTATVKEGNCLELRDIPAGTAICSIGLQVGQGGRLCRAAGTAATLASIDPDPGPWAHVRLPSGEVRKILKQCTAVIGRISNPTHQGRILGKAGRARWLGLRPKVRGMAKNAYV